MMNYNQYLRLQGFAEATIKRFEGRTKEFETWLRRRKLNESEVNYSDLMKYIKHLKKRKLSDTTINNHLAAIRSFFSYVIACELRNDNPVKEIKIKTAQRKHSHTLLTELELEDLYHSFEITGKNDYIKATALRNKIIVGLMVFQGLGNASLKALEIDHLKLDRGKIYVPGTTRTKARNLELRSVQIAELLQYQNDARDILSRRIKMNQHKLFSLGDKTKFTGITEVIIKRLKTYNAKVKNVPQLRASVITNWLKQHNVRRVQFLAGHKRIMSTEFYKQEHIEKLQNVINKFHPLG